MQFRTFPCGRANGPDRIPLSSLVLSAILIRPSARSSASNTELHALKFSTTTPHGRSNSSTPAHSARVRSPDGCRLFRKQRILTLLVRLGRSANESGVPGRRSARSAAWISWGPSRIGTGAGRTAASSFTRPAIPESDPILQQRADRGRRPNLRSSPADPKGAAGQRRFAQGADEADAAGYAGCGLRGSFAQR